MSQAGVLTVNTSGASIVEFLTGNSGGAVGPDASHNINVIGNNTTGINIVGTPGSNTLTVVGIQATTTQRGTVELATGAESIAGTDSVLVITPSTLLSKLGTLTNHGVLVGAGSATAITALSVATNGQVLLGSTAADPVFGTLTSSDSSITFTTGAGALGLTVTGGSTVGKTITGTTGGALSPTAGNWNILGASTAAGTTPVNTSGAVSTLTVNVQKSQAIASTDATKVGLAAFDSAAFAVDANGFVSLAGGGLAIDSIHPDSGTDPVVPTAGGLVNIVGSGSTTTVGSLNTLTVQLTGLTDHAVLVGAGTSTITKVGPVASTGCLLASNGVASDPGFTTATYPLTTTINQILYSSANNTVTGLATANRAVYTTDATGVPVATALATDGQLIIGSTAGAPAAATLTAGTGIAITVGSNSISIAANGAVAWTDVTGASQTIAVNNNYLSDRAGAVAFTLPASATQGDMFRIAGVQGSWTLAQAANQQIKLGSSATTVGATGSLASTNANDCIECVATNTSASTVWLVISSMGNITVA